jgi:hypothetical protein
VNATAPVSTKHLSTYLNDHLAGSVIALELIEHIAKKFPDSDLEVFFAELHADISADQDVLRDLLNTFGESESTVRKAGAWLVEKLGRVKLGLTENEVSGRGTSRGARRSRARHHRQGIALAARLLPRRRHRRS